MAKKKEKKIPEKQLMYEQMLTQQLYGGQPSREEGIAKLQSEYDAWNARQDGIAKLQSDYDNWLNEQQKAQQPVDLFQKYSYYYLGPCKKHYALLNFLLLSSLHALSHPYK